MFVRNPGYAEQLARWGLNEVTAALAFPAQVGLPSAAPAWQRLNGETIPPAVSLSNPPAGPDDEATPPAKELTYRLTSAPDEPAWRSRPLLLRQRRFDPPTWRYLLRSSRSAREAANLRRLDELGIPCPPVVAVGQVRQPAGPPTRLFFALLAIAFVLGLVTWVVGDFFSWFAGPRMDSIVSKAVAKLIDHVLSIGLTVMAISGAGIVAGLAVVALLRWVNRDYFVGEAMILADIQPGESLQSFARSRWATSAPAALTALAALPEQRVEPALRDRQVRRLSQRLAGQLAVAHRARFIHRDLKFANLHVCWPKSDANGEDLRLIWSACPRGRRRWLPLPDSLRRGRIADLARLDRDSFAVLRPAERLRFLHAYLRNLGGESADRASKWKSIARKVLAAHGRFLPARPRPTGPPRPQPIPFPHAVSPARPETPSATQGATQRPVKRKRKRTK